MRRFIKPSHELRAGFNIVERMAETERQRKATVWQHIAKSCEDEKLVAFAEPPDRVRFYCTGCSHTFHLALDIITTGHPIKCPRKSRHGTGARTLPHTGPQAIIDIDHEYRMVNVFCLGCRNVVRLTLQEAEDTGTTCRNCVGPNGEILPFTPERMQQIEARRRERYQRSQQEGVVYRTCRMCGHEWESAPGVDRDCPQCAATQILPRGPAPGTQQIRFGSYICTGCNRRFPFIEGERPPTQCGTCSGAFR